MSDSFTEVFVTVFLATDYFYTYRTDHTINFYIQKIARNVKEVLKVNIFYSENGKIDYLVQI